MRGVTIYKARQDRKLKNQGDNESRGSVKESLVKVVEVVWACDRRGEHCVGRRAMVMEVHGRRRREGLREDGWTG